MNYNRSSRLFVTTRQSQKVGSPLGTGDRKNIQLCGLNTLESTDCALKSGQLNILCERLITTSHHHLCVIEATPKTAFLWTRTSCMSVSESIQYPTRQALRKSRIRTQSKGSYEERSKSSFRFRCAWRNIFRRQEPLDQTILRSITCASPISYPSLGF